MMVDKKPKIAEKSPYIADERWQKLIFVLALMITWLSILTWKVYLG